MNARLYINGVWKNTERYETLYAPYSGERLAEVGQADERDTDEAIAAAARAAPVMAAMPAHERAAILDEAVRQLEARREEFARLLALEAAKPIRAAMAELGRTIQTYRFAAMEARRIHGETIPLDAAPGGEGRIAFTLRRPVGVVGAITPFNFPFNLVAHKVGPAIAAGNTVVLKPASQTPLSALALADLFAEAGLPAGALNIVPGPGTIVGERLVRDERVKAITFTGSAVVGAAMRQKAGLKRMTLELGSNSALIVDRGVDISDSLIERVVTGAFSYSGQVCISIQRIYVHAEIFEAFVTKLKARTEQLVVGDPLDERTDVSALIRPAEVRRMEDWVASAVASGAQVVTGGCSAGPSIFMPTILIGVPSDEPASCQEAFGPLVTVTPFASLDEALAEANRSRYGLQAGIYTRDIQAAMRAAMELDVGGVMINDIPTFRVDHMPYGGVKDSGSGREGIRYAIEEMTELKLIAIRMGE